MTKPYECDVSILSSRDFVANISCAMSRAEEPLYTKIRMIEKSEYDKLLSKHNKAMELLCDCFFQACNYGNGEKAQFDHMCLSAYESTQDFLIECGMIKKEDCCRG